MNTNVVAQRTASLEEAYEASQKTAILVDRSNLGLLKFSGQTRLDLLNRMSTQKLDDLRTGEGAATILTSDIGRIIDRLILYADHESVFCLTSEDNGDNIARYLMRFVFFQDDFHIEDLSGETAVIAIYGRNATEHLGTLFGKTIDLSLHHWQEVDIQGIKGRLHKTDAVAGEGYFIMCPMSDWQQVWNGIASTGIVPSSIEAFDYLRIKDGNPRFGHELTLDYIPLEANLWDDVSFNKGCYTGQEIIARMESRGRLAKKLVRLRPESSLESGIELTMEGKKVGSITSAANGPEGPMALGFVKSAALQNEQPLTANSITVNMVDTIV